MGPEGGIPSEDGCHSGTRGDNELLRQGNARKVCGDDMPIVGGRSKLCSYPRSSIRIL